MATATTSRHTELPEAQEILRPGLPLHGEGAIARQAQGGRRGNAPGRKKVGASLRLATENIRGRGAAGIAGSAKWKALADDIRRHKIGVMAIQETHMTEIHVNEVHQYYGHLTVINSSLPENPSGAGGVALVFNNHLTKSKEIESKVLIPGRAIVAKLNWNRDDDLVIMAVYAPTRRRDNHDMWERIQEALLDDAYDFRMPDVLLGDFNFVEDAIDRFPARISPMDAPETFMRLKATMQMSDRWRETFPTSTEWTWRSSDRAAMSRIDRVYMTRRVLLTSRCWQTELSGLTVSDHSRLSVEIVNPDMPALGPGRWAMPASLMRDETFLTAATKRGLQAQAEILQYDGQARRTQAANPQKAWAQMKRDIGDLARRRSKEIAGARSAAMRKQEEERHQLKTTIAAGLQPPEAREALSQLRTVEEAIHATKRAAHSTIFAHRDARNWREAETMCKSWFRWTKDRRPRDTMTALRKPGQDPPAYATDSKSMAELARDYHDGVQSLDLAHEGPDAAAATAATLDHVRRRLEPRQRAAVGAPASADEVEAAIKAAKSGSAAGLDGITYEFWKELAQRHRKRGPNADPTFDVINTMTAVFLDVEEHGVEPLSNFAEGWLCPLYKKGDRSEIANYRPITLLNTDYKVYTKVIATRLADVAADLIHEAQAGFMKGRSITSHAKITALLLSYAEATEQNGMIVALDQEKAYDKIRHDYLYEVLRRFGFPERLIRTIRALYERAETCVIINGIKSSRYRVTRGVRQGDPLSCLLFNLAIEPLAEMMRASTLKGYPIPGLTERLIATLYADDTTVYLAADDSYDALRRLLDVWCMAAGAKFNIQKTEIIPLGGEQFRTALIESRRLNQRDGSVPDGIRIARDGETTRILGTWPGNGVTTAGAWSLVKDKILDSLSRWETKHPTFNGKGLLSHTVIGGFTQYLTAAQGMPAKVEKSLDSIALDFFWNHARRHPVNMEALRRGRRSGGANLLHVAARNDAQYMTWLGEYLAPAASRPTWAYIADQLFQGAIIGKDKMRVPESSRTNPFAQDWCPNMRRLPFILKCMVRTARKYHLAMDAPCVPQSAKEQMHLWSHPALIERDQWRRTGQRTRCLRVKHEVHTVDDLEEMAELDESDHEPDSRCGCANCVEDRRHGCRHPHKCQETAEEFLGAIAEKWNPSTVWPTQPRPVWDALEGQRSTAMSNGEAIAFDTSEAQPQAASDLFRICVNALAIQPQPAAELMRSEAARKDFACAGEEEAVTAVVCATVREADTAEKRAGIAVHFPDGEYPDVAAAVLSEPVSLPGTTARAILAAIEAVGTAKTLHIVTPAKSVVTALTTKLRDNASRGWLDWPGAETEMRIVTAALRARTGETTFTCLDKKRAKEWPELHLTRTKTRAGDAAIHGDGVQMNDDLYVPFDAPGIGLAGLRQRTAHKAIRRATELDKPTRRQTQQNLDMIRASIEASCSYSPTDEQIWAGLASKDFSRNARNFIWKAIHGAHKVGAYFEKMPEPWRSKKDCPTCGSLESLEHILFHCSDSGQERVWALVHKELDKKVTGLDLDMGSVLGVGCITLPKSDGVRDGGAERAARILVSEASFLIWKLRCKRRIEHGEDEHWQPPSAEVEGAWTKILDTRKAQDEILKRKQERAGKKPPKKGVGDTWVDNSEPWAHNLAAMMFGPGVLVGAEAEGRGGVG